MFVAFHYFFKINAYIIYIEIFEICTLINDSLKWFMRVIFIFKVNKRAPKVILLTLNTYLLRVWSNYWLRVKPAVLLTTPIMTKAKYLKITSSVQHLSRKCVAILQDQEAVTQWCSVKKVFLEIPQNSHEKTCTRVYFLQ